MKHFFNTRLLSLLMLSVCTSLFSCKDDEPKETINEEVELALAGDWYPMEYTFEYGGSETPVYYDMCSEDWDAHHANSAYTEGLDVVSWRFELNEDKNAVVTPVCTESDEQTYTWSVVDKDSGTYLKLVGSGKTITYKIKSRSSGQIKLYPEGFGLDEKFVAVFSVPK
jgi:hypothetical protein